MQRVEVEAVVGDVRGLGTFWAVEFVLDRATKEPAVPYLGAKPGEPNPVNEVVAGAYRGARFSRFP